MQQLVDLLVQEEAERLMRAPAARVREAEQREAEAQESWREMVEQSHIRQPESGCQTRGHCRAAHIPRAAMLPLAEACQLVAEEPWEELTTNR